MSTTSTTRDRQLPAWDEARFGDERGGAPRGDAYAAVLEALEATDLAELKADVAQRMGAAGATFGEEPFGVCPVPRLLDADEWRLLSAGLAQRVRALSAFVADAYGERRIVEAGVVPARVIDEADGYEPSLAGRWPGGPIAIGVAGLDVVRDRDGELRVLEDNLRTPSGVAYAVAARAAVTDALRAALPQELWDALPEPVALEPAVVEALRATVFDAAAAVRERLGGGGETAGGDGAGGDGAGGDAADGEASGDRARLGDAAGDAPTVVVLTDGPGSSAAFEHDAAARWLDAPLVTLGDLDRRGDELWLRDGAHGGARRVDAVYRRSDEDRVQDEGGAPTDVAKLLLEPWLAGRVALVNPFGTGVADDKLAHAYVEAMIRFYLGEEPLLRSVETLDLADSGARERVLADLRAHVVKPRHGQGGHGVVVCTHAHEDDLRRLAAELAHEDAGERWIAQRTVALSCHPTIAGDRLEPRHVDLRPFIFSTRAGASVIPGGLTRVAWDRGALVVNSSQDGGAKDTWVLMSETG